MEYLFFIVTIRSYPIPIPVSMDDSIDEYEDEYGTNLVNP